jgi:heat shock protein HslJ
MRSVSILIVMVLLVAGCARPKATALPTPDVMLAGTAWTVERIDDDAADRAAATVRFEDGRASGRSGCNQYSGYLQASGSALRVSEMRSTRMACAPAVMEQETRFLTALAAARAARREGDRLVLLDEGGRARLRLMPATPAAETASAGRTRVYECAGGVALALTETTPDAVDAWLSDGRHRLTRAPTASGARYTDGQVSIWNKGAELLLERDDRSWRCIEQQPAAPR